MKKKDFEKELIELNLDVDIEDVWNEYAVKVLPYLGFVSNIRLEDGRPNQEKIRKVLGVRVNTWKVLKKLNAFREVMDLDNDYMKYHVRKKVLDLLNKEEPSAKDVELALKVFDDEFGVKKPSTSNLPTHLKIGIYDASMDEKDIKAKAKIEDKSND